MEIVNFILKPIITKVIEMVSASILKKFFIVNKLKKIKDFQAGFEGSSLDTNTFQNFLNEKETSNLIFEYVFGAKYINQSKSDFIEHLSAKALQKINEFRKKSKMKELSNEPALNSYFEKLLSYLEKVRDTKFKPNEMQMIANIQSSIVETNEELKEFLEKNLYELEQKSLLKKYDDEYLKKLLARATLDLGKRYNAVANVETKYNKAFQSIVGDETICAKFSNVFEEFKLAFRELEINLNFYFSELDYDVNFINEFLTRLNEYDFGSMKFYKRENIEAVVKLCDEVLANIDKLKYQIYSEEKNNNRSTVLKSINKINKLSNEIDEKISLYKPNLIDEPYILFYGDGGIGKSHLLADNAIDLEKKGHTVLFFLGQHFNTKEHPIDQMFKLIDYAGTKDFFFNEMNKRAKLKNKRMVIFIDAMNEGEGKFFWRNYLLDFLNYLKEFENVSIVLSVRSNFLRSILPENLEVDFPLHRQELRGFEDLTVEQLEPFFNYYGINPVIVPSLERECHNPLFLQIYCEAVEDEECFRGWSILDLLSKYVLKVNSRLAIDTRFEFPDNINLVDKVLKALSNWFLVNKKQIIEVDEFYLILKDVCSKYTDGYQKILLGLVEENLLTVSKGYHDKEFVYFTYERFSDIYVSLNILDEYRKDSQSVIESVTADLFYTGINESLIIVFAENLSQELLDVLPEEAISIELAESFIRGISWRNVSSINKNTIKWLKICVLQESESLRALTYERLLKQSIVENSPINSLLLNEILFEMDMADRDFSWTIAINSIETPINLINHVINNTMSFKEFKKENVRLLSYSLIWLLSSTNGSIRDVSSNALSRIYLVHEDILLDNLKMFINVNDPYILERVLASVYGAITRKDEFNFAHEIVNLIYSKIFDQKEVYPNILIRDYARGTILYCAKLKAIDIQDYCKVQPPYNSIWFSKAYTNEEIDNVSNDIRKKSELPYSGFDYIIKSMTTEYGRGVSRYGDFGRYTFGSAVREWKNQFDDQFLANIAIMKTIEYGYDENKHGEFDINISRYRSHITKAERIGKKYQWLALYEVLAKLCDNYPPYTEKKLYTPEYNEYKRDEAKRISEMIRMSSDTLYPRKTNPTMQSKVMKEIDHYIGKLKITKTYTGIWDSFVRKYDPTILIPPPQKSSKSLLPSLLPYRPNKKWAQSKAEFSMLEKFIDIDFDGNRYISLAQLQIQKKDHGSGKFEEKDEFCIKTKAVLIDRDKSEMYITRKLKQEENIGISWGQSTGVYAMEHYWHPSFKVNFYNENRYEFKCEDAVWEYYWESNTDIQSYERETYTYLMPHYEIIDYFNLVQTTEGIWKDSEGNVIALDAKYFGYDTNLLVRVEAIQEYLEVFNLDLIWECYMEKWSDRSRKEEWFICWKEDDQLKYSVLEEYCDNDVKDFI